MERIAFLIEHSHQQLRCLLNPDSLVMRRVAGVKPRRLAAGRLTGAGLADDPLIYTGGGRTELDLQLLFDVSLPGSNVSAVNTPFGAGDVRSLTRPLWDLAENREQDGRGQPPIVRLIWGKAWNEPGVVVAVSERLEHFTSTGVPRRSWLSLRLVRVKEPPSLIRQAAAVVAGAAAAVGAMVHEVSGALATQASTSATQTLATAETPAPPEGEVTTAEEMIADVYDEVLAEVSALWYEDLAPAISQVIDFFSWGDDGDGDGDGGDGKSGAETLIDEDAPAEAQKQQRNLIDRFVDGLTDAGEAMASLFSWGPSGDDVDHEVPEPGRDDGRAPGTTPPPIPGSTPSPPADTAPRRTAPRPPSELPEPAEPPVRAARAGRLMREAQRRAQAALDAVGDRMEESMRDLIAQMVERTADSAAMLLEAPVRAARMVETRAKATLQAEAQRMQENTRVLDAAVSAAAAGRGPKSGDDPATGIDRAAAALGAALARLGDASERAGAAVEVAENAAAVAGKNLAQALERIYTSLDGLYASGQDTLAATLGATAAELESARRNTEAAGASTASVLYLASTQRIEVSLEVLLGEGAAPGGAGGAGSASGPDDDAGGSGGSGRSRVPIDEVRLALDAIEEAALGCSEPISAGPVSRPDRDVGAGAADLATGSPSQRSAAAAREIHAAVTEWRSELAGERNKTVSRAEIQTATRRIQVATRAWRQSGQAATHKVVAAAVGHTVRHPPGMVERIDQIAVRYYSAPSAWRVLAAANGIDDPLELVGQPTLRVPPGSGGAGKR